VLWIADTERLRWSVVVLTFALAIAPPADLPEPQPVPELPLPEEPAIEIPHWGLCGFSGDNQAAIAYAHGDLQAAVDAILAEADTEPEPDPDKYRLAELYSHLARMLADPAASLAELREAIRIDNALGGLHVEILLQRLRERQR